ncbi:hypothetical protein DENSPDRAFT_848096 [Dentipellis sp. KUC8613]|nr:hypothetical protein DENSPDRAFT_848096 [Dentipellis sp. KUC8613]
MSEWSDSPSVYSHAHFSPRPIDRAELDANTAGFDFSIPSQYRTHPYHSDRDRLNDPSASTLDLDDDSTSSRPNSQAHFHHGSSTPSPPVHDSDSDVDAADPRMSMLGPKMRFHSPAPWELDEDPVQEQDEPDDDARSFVSRRGRMKNKGEGFIKGLNLSSLNSRNHSASRPSADCHRPGGKEKLSFETSSSYVSVSQGALQTLAQASMSTSSLAPSQTPLRGKFSLPRVRTRTVSNTSAAKPSLSPHSTVFPAQSLNMSPVSHPSRPDSPAPSVLSSQLARTDTRASSRPGSPRSMGGQDDYVHPYANPELVQRTIRPSHLCQTRVPSSVRDMESSDSSATFPDSNTTRSSSPSRSASAATITMTPDTSASSFGQDATYIKRPTPSLQGRTISGPMPVEPQSPPMLPKTTTTKAMRRETKLLPPQSMNQMAGWGELPASPTFTLISLQEAQAQARDRSRNNTVQPPTNLAKAPFLDQEPPSRYTTSSTNTATRARAHSTGANTKGKTVLHNLSTTTSPSSMARTDMDASPVGNTPARGLKHKKSGFMRLFNGREKDKGTQSSPTPPVSLSGDAGISSVSPLPMPKTPKITTSRVPVPALTSFSHSEGSTNFDDVASGESEVTTAPSRTERSPHGRRYIPPLSIRTPSDKASHLTAQSPVQPALSAPAGTTEFPSLSLRPVSTIFSAHFSEHLIEGESPLDQEADNSTSTSGFSPVTPGFPNRSSGDKSAAVVEEDESYSVVRALQNQIATSRKAWQQQIWELEGQVHDLRAEVEELRAKEASGEHCPVCGRGASKTGSSDGDDSARQTGVVNRPRARTGVGTRFGAAIAA